MNHEIPGAVIHGEGDLVLNESRHAIELEVSNSGDRAVQVGSHFHFFEANAALRFDREKAFGRRLDIPSGTAVRFEAGQTHRVSLVPFGGDQRIIGFNGLTNAGSAQDARERAVERGFIA